MRRLDLIRYAWHALTVWAIIVSLIYFWQFWVLVPSLLQEVLRQWQPSF